MSKAEIIKILLRLIGCLAFSFGSYICFHADRRLSRLETAAVVTRLTLDRICNRLEIEPAKPADVCIANAQPEPHRASILP